MEWYQNGARLGDTAHLELKIVYDRSEVKSQRIVEIRRDPSNDRGKRFDVYTSGKLSNIDSETDY